MKSLIFKCLSLPSGVGAARHCRAFWGQEVAPAPARVRAAYTAGDWDRLVALKNRYDPQNTFRFNRNIPPSFPPGAVPAPGEDRV